jgi:nucleoside-diphosphate-sugar epimerase
MPMRALVTGCSGFVGRHMIDALDRNGWDTAGIDTADGFDALDYFQSKSARWDLVVHAAASAPHRAAIDGEAEHFARNVHLDSAMFDWAVRTDQGRVLYLSSSAAYPIELQDGLWHGPGGLSEDVIHLAAAEEPDSAYGWTKLTGERLAAAARRKGLPVTVVRPFSGYGEDQSENFPFRALVERARRKEEPFTIWGDGRQVRDWIHIDDVVAGALAVAESGTEDPVNLCTGVGTSMVELAQLACEQVGYQPEFEFRLDKPAGVAYRVGDPARLHQYYKPTVTLAEGVARALKG